MMKYEISRKLIVILGLCACISGCVLLALQGDKATIENDTVRVQAIKQGEDIVLRVETRNSGESWRTVLSTAEKTDGDRTMIEDIEIDATQAYYDGRMSLFTEAAVESDGETLVLRGVAGVHHLTQRITIKGDGHLYVTVEDSVKDHEGEIDVGRLMNHFYFVPDKQTSGYTPAMDFEWLPNLHINSGSVCGDAFFRSPAVIVVADGVGAAIVPDLDVLAANRKVPHALDLRPHKSNDSITRLSYGLCSYHIEGHVYSVAADRTKVIADKMEYAFDLFISSSEDGQSLSARVTTYLWERYAVKYMKNIRPQVLPFEEYGRRYGYVHELKDVATKATINGVECYGLKHPGRHGANFHAWENDLHSGFGVWYYGKKWGDQELQRIGKGILNLSLAAPTKEGAFPCIYTFNGNRWEGSLHWPIAHVRPHDDYDIQAMGVSAWLRLYWHDCFPSLRSPKLMKSVDDLARFFAEKQLPSGAVPTYYDDQLSPSPKLKESATTAIAGAVMARAAMINKDEKLKQAAIKAGRFLEREILPTNKYQDFEVFFSCSPKPLGWIDPVNGMHPMNTLSAQWSADHFLALYQLTGEKHWLDKGEHCLVIVSLYHQVWDPPYLDKVYVFGGFGVMNTDGEWNDGRQARFALTYADYYRQTGNIEYLQRAVTAVRASMALMDIKENHQNKINEVTAFNINKPGQGYSAENCYHGGPEDSRNGWSGFNWGGGGGISSAAYLEHYFGSVWIDGKVKLVVPIDGVSAEITSWQNDHIVMKIENALLNLPYPFTGERKLIVKFGHMPLDSYTVEINGQKFENMTREEMITGTEIVVKAEG